MTCRNVLCIFGVIIYIISELVSLLLVFIILAKDRVQISSEIFHFSFGLSAFDIVLFGILRFSILFGASIGLIYNNMYAMYRLQKCKKFTVYYGCIQATYIVMKILVSTEQNDHHNPKRFWIMVAITLLSSVMFYCCWTVLACCKKSTRTLMLNVSSEDETKENDSTGNTYEDNENDQWEINSSDKIKAENLMSGSIMIELFKMAKPDYLFLMSALTFLVICSICQTFIPYYTGLIVNYIVIDKNVKKYNNALVCMTLITLLGGFAAGIRAGFFRYMLGRYKLRLQSTLFSNFMKMEIGFFDSRKTGELSSRLTTDCTKVSDGIGLNLNIFLRSVVKIIGILFFMVKLSWKLSTVTLVAMPVVTIVSDYFGVKYKVLSEKVQNTLAYANSSAEEAISSMRTVRSFAAEKNEANRYFKLLDLTRLCMRKQSIISACYRWSMEMTSFVMTLLILYYGGRLVMLNDLPGGHLISFILYSFQLTNSIQDIGLVYTGLMEVIGASKNIFFYINRKPTVKMNGELLPDSGIDGHIEFKDVSFAYPTREDVQVLQNLSFTAEKGEVVALVGPSGGGKSSVINLLQHFYEPKQGKVLIDGVSVKDYNHNFLHEKMSLVQQEPTLFARTISENITYGLQGNVSEADIQYSAELANANLFISSMPEKYETQTGEKGVQLSGGQKQRVAIARALIRNPTILLLDEATSALDSESEHLVQQAINKNLSGRTVIIIAHRLSTVEKADKILVMEKGEIVETGKHQELIELQGAYSSLVKKQLLGVSEEAAEQMKIKVGSSKVRREVGRKYSFGGISCSSSKSVTSNVST